MVEVIGTIYHRADMNKLDNFLDVIRLTEDTELYNAIANEYWKAGTHTFVPAYEVLCDSAMVIKALTKENDLELFKEELLKFNVVEYTPTYQKLLSQLTDIEN